MNLWLRRSGYVVALGLAGLYISLLLWGPQGVPSLLAKQREIRTLEEQNENLRREIERRKDRIHRLKESAEEQDMEIRRQLKLSKPGETQFILPDTKLPDAKPAEPAATK
jgi:cell division protein FtsB